MDSLLRKLQVKGAASLEIIQKPPKLKLASIKGKGGVHVRLVFPKDKKELIRYAPRKIPTEDILWIAYPKDSSKIDTDLNRDIL